MQNRKKKFIQLKPKHKKYSIGYLIIIAVVCVSAVSLYFLLNGHLKNALAEESLTSGNDYLTLTASGGDVDVTCYFPFETNNNIYFSKDNGSSWNLWDTNPYNLENGKSIQFKSQNVPDNENWSKLNSFEFESTSPDAFIDCSGSVMSIVDGTGLTTQIPNNYKFESLFYDCTLLRTAPKLPATQLQKSCYSSMFSGCSQLKTAPKLPATQLQESCYASMFSGCSQLQNVPNLPAIEVPKTAYISMFYHCSGLANPPSIEAKKLGDSACEDMFNSCTSLTKTSKFNFTEIDRLACEYMYQSCTNLTFAYDLYPKTIPEYAYAYMFQNCLSLEKAPEIFGEIYGENCCAYMFEMGRYNNSNLIYSPDLHCKTLSKNSCEAMFEFCEDLQNCPKVPATKLEEKCCYLMFYSCTRVVNGPELMATQLYNECYHNMFGDCVNLRYIKVGFNTWPTEENALKDWVSGVPTSSKEDPGVFDAPEELSWIYDQDHIPGNWINAVNVDVEVYDGIYDGKPHCPIKSINVTKPANPDNPCEITYSLDGETWFEDISKLEYTEIGNYEFYVKVISYQQFDPDLTSGTNEMRKQFADFNKKFVSTIRPIPPVPPTEEIVQAEYIQASTSAETGDNILFSIIVILSIGLIAFSSFIIRIYD